MWTFGALDHTTTTTLTKLSPTGVTLFQATFGSTPNDLVQGRGVSVDVARGDVVLAGTYYGAPSIGGAALPSVGNGAAIFVTKFSAGGVHLWDRVFASASDAGLCYWQANAIARHSTGDLIVSASLSGQGPGASCGITIGGATAPPGVFVARLSDVDGTPVWANFGAGGESACVTSQDAVVTSGLSGTLSHLLADGGGPSWTARLPNNTASQVVCGGDLGERSLAAGGAPTLLQAVEENGALGWGVTLPNPASPSLALGPNRAFVLAGATGQSPPFGTEDVYFARYVR